MLLFGADMEEAEIAPSSDQRLSLSRSSKKRGKKKKTTDGKDDAATGEEVQEKVARRRRKTVNSKDIKDKRAAKLEKRANAKENANYVNVRSSRSRKSAVAVARPAVCLLCEWETCEAQFDNMVTFLTHVQDHLFTVFHSLCTDSENGDLHEIDVVECEWRECGHEVAHDFQELVRHVYLHAYHAKIKDIGARLVVDWGMNPCIFDTASRNMIPELPERLLCGWEECGKVYDNAEFFYQHVNSHAEIYGEGNLLQEGATCSWEGCSSSFKSKHKLRDHLRSHTQEKLVACPTCGNLFSTNTRFLDHLNRQKNTDMQAFQCSHCKKKFASERLLRDHMRHHVNHYKCQQCEMTCTTPSTLRQHMKSRHSEDRPFTCTVCNASFKRPSDQRRHMEFHNASRYKCHMKDCKYECISYASLSHHFRKSHQGENMFKYACHVCDDMLFTRGTGLTRHLKRVHNFTWPPGHRRFKYKEGEDGYKRLNTIRYESIELTEQILTTKLTNENTPASKSRDQESSEDGLTPPLSKRRRKNLGQDFSYNLEMLGEVAEKSEKIDLGRKAVKLKQNRRRKIGARNLASGSGAKILDCDTEKDEELANCDNEMKPRGRTKKSSKVSVDSKHLSMPTLDSLVTADISSQPDADISHTKDVSSVLSEETSISLKSEEVLTAEHKHPVKDGLIDAEDGADLEEKVTSDCENDEELENVTIVNEDGDVITRAVVSHSNLNMDLPDPSDKPIAETSAPDSHPDILLGDESVSPVEESSLASNQIAHPSSIAVEIVKTNSSKVSKRHKLSKKVSNGTVDELIDSRDADGNAIAVSCDSSRILYGTTDNSNLSTDFAQELIHNMKLASASSIIIDPATGSVEYSQSSQ